MVMWVKQCHKAPMTGNGKHTTKFVVIWGMVYYCFIHINHMKQQPGCIRTYGYRLVKMASFERVI